MSTTIWPPIFLPGIPPSGTGPTCRRTSGNSIGAGISTPSGTPAASGISQPRLSGSRGRSAKGHIRRWTYAGRAGPHRALAPGKGRGRSHPATIATAPRSAARTALGHLRRSGRATIRALQVGCAFVRSAHPVRAGRCAGRPVGGADRRRYRRSRGLITPRPPRLSTCV